VSGVANRRSLELLLDSLYEASVGGERIPGSFAVIAIVGLASLNETRGHDVGDRFLRAFATALTAALPAGRVYRYSGDAFALRAEERLDPRAVREAADRVVASMHDLGFEAIGVTLGVASLEEADGSPRGALRLADTLRAQPPD
jgi:diguanylate cyclase (GGDEF)-like protein